MTKLEFIDYIRDHFKRYFKAENMHEVIIEKACTTAFNQRLNDVFVDSPYKVDSFVKFYTESVQYDSTNDVYYTLLTHKYVPFPDTRSGVRNILLGRHGGYKFIPMTLNDMEMIESTYWSKISSSTIGYVVNRDRIEYYNMDEEITSLRVGIVPQFDELDDNDVLYVAMGREWDILTLVIDLLSNKTGHDLIDNNKNDQ